ncbi:16S rRNA (uracil(1498)-N(3))-methyltransferase [Aquabacterium sp.]|uniref:16S rRNA (uracil(1498)-N(3))-methyltransferase n=1 Tax=Aquabacterium sp. TaxID=1872578 RepID=UPI0035B4C6E2
MPHRLFVELALSEGLTCSLPEGPTRHTQVLRMQPGDALTLFNGQGGEWSATVDAMSRSETVVCIGSYVECSRELPVRVTLAVGMPANERMDWLVEKAAELGAFAIQPLECQRSVLRLSGARADKRVTHWQAVAISACEQSGRTAVPIVHPIRTAADWLVASAQPGTHLDIKRYVLSLREATDFASTLGRAADLRDAMFFSGPEGGLTEGEEAAALAAGFAPVSLGPRVLRADTAPLAALAILGAR